MCGHKRTDVFWFLRLASVGVVVVDEWIGGILGELQKRLWHGGSRLRKPKSATATPVETRLGR